MEALYECSVGHIDRKRIYNRFCDRLETKKHATLIRSIENVFKLEFPYLPAYLFTPVDEDKADLSFDHFEKLNMSHDVINKPDTKNSQQKFDQRISLRERAMRLKN